MNLNGVTNTSGNATDQNALVGGIGYPGQLGDRSPVPGSVEPKFQVHFFVINGHGIDVPFDTFVLQVAHIGEDEVREIGAGDGGDDGQKIVGLLFVIINRTVDAVFEKAVIQTNVGAGGFFPLEVGVKALRAQHREEIVTKLVIGRRCALAVVGQIAVIANTVLLAGDAPTNAQLHIGDSGKVVKEAQIAHAPGKGH